MTQNSIVTLNKKITKCKKCPRLASYVRQVAKIKVKRHITEKYWGKPVPGFGDVHAKVLIVGLAPAAHGANRTGRMFTGDSSGDWLARALYKNGFANKPASVFSDDGLVLHDAYVTAAVRCAPPQNKPLTEEYENCFSYLDKEFTILQNIKVIVCLGHIAYNTVCKLLKTKKETFAHGKSFTINDITVICSYHPSRQNTNTGRLTWNMWNMIFRMAQKYMSRH